MCFWLAGVQPGYRNTFIVSNSDSCSSLRGVLRVTCTGRHRCHVLCFATSVIVQERVLYVFLFENRLMFIVQLYTISLLSSPTEGMKQTDKIDSNEPGMKS